VTFAIALMFASLVVLVYFVHHLSHSIQIDEVMVGVERATVRVVEHDLPTRGVGGEELPETPVWAVAVPALTSGYVQTVNPDWLLRIATESSLVCAVVPFVGDHVVAGQPLAWLWRTSPEQAPPDPAAYAGFVRDAVRIGYERTTEQDVAFGIRQLVDIAVKALSPAVNDPYTGMQALEHLSVVLAALAPRALGHQVLSDGRGTVRVAVPGRDFTTYLDLATSQIRRYGATEPRVLGALVQVLGKLGPFCRDESGRRALAAALELVVEAAEQGIAQDGDRAPVTTQAAAALATLAG
jgi:uncharacterized membrane protein